MATSGSASPIAIESETPDTQTAPTNYPDILMMQIGTAPNIVYIISPTLADLSVTDRNPIISFNKLNFLNPPLPLVIGRGSHGTKKFTIPQLTKYLERSTTPYDVGCSISVLLRPADLSPTSISMGQVGYQAPNLELSDVGKQNSQILMHGDRDCLTALRTIKAIYNKRSKKIMERKAWAEKEINTLNVTLQGIERELDKVKEEMESWSTCSVAVYDAGSCHSLFFIYFIYYLIHHRSRPRRHRHWSHVLPPYLRW